MPHLSKSFGISGLLALTTTKETGALSREDGCKLTRPLFILLIICVFSSAAFGQPWDGNGVEGDPYQIWTAADMQAIGADENYWDAHFVLMADIDLSSYMGTSFNIIGTDWDNPFTGVFDGNSHTISNFTYTSTGTSYIGLFGCVKDPNAEIKDLGLINPDVDAREQVGSLVGRIEEGSISNCYVEGDSVSGDEWVGGLVGRNYYGTISNCYSTGSVSGTGWHLGGLVADNYYGTISNCYSEGSVTGTDSDVGGLVGRNYHGTISNCYSTGSVSGTRYDVGGLVGGNSGTITNCYATSSVSGDDNVGGLVGGNRGAVIHCYSTGNVLGTGSYIGGLVGWNEDMVSSSFWDKQTSGQSTSGGGEGKTTAEMKTASTFLGWGSCGSEGVWVLDEGNDYPRLWWENKAGQPISTQLSDLLAGTGTEQDPYLIATDDQLNLVGLFRCEWDKYFKLMADIDLSGYTGTSFNTIGYYTSSSNYAPFAGVFDGNGHTISNFTYTSTWTSYIGLFGCVKDPNAEIKDLGLINPDVNARSYVGSLVGHNEEATITNCYVDGGSVSGDDYIGGLVGWNGRYDIGGTITDCYSTASVSGRGSVGGLVGRNYYGTISNCYSRADISGEDEVGGLVGRNETVGWEARITNCYSTGSVTGTGRYVGGLLGYSRRAEIYNCYSTASVSGEQYVGGLVGYKESGLISNCYSTGSVSGSSGVGVGGLVGTGGTVYGSFWDIQTSGQTTSAGGTGLTTAQMKDANTYLYWGCGLVWTIDDGVDYPHLIWEGMPGEIISAQLSDLVGGSGSETDPYLIYTTEELNLIGLFWCEFDKCFKLMADIDLSGYSGTSFNIIGHNLNPFTGVFDGNGHTISNFTYDVSGLSYPYDLYLGLFGSAVGPSVEIKDLGLIDPNVNGVKGNRVGALVGYMNKTDITNCYVDGGSISGIGGSATGGSVGGLVGVNKTVDGEARITNCYSTAIVSGVHYVGGLVGYTRGGEIFNCYSTGTVSATGHDVGGLVGKDYRGTVSNSYATGSVTGTERVGGLVGRGRSGEISNCYSTGTVSATGHDVGGLVGMSKAVINCYSTASVSGSAWVGGLVGGNLGTITNCYSAGSVTATTNSGGLVGENWGTITNCYSSSSVSGATDIGGLVGENYILITNSFWDTQTSGRTNMCGSSQSGASGCDDDNGKTTAQMQTENTFTDAGWDFVGEVINGPNDIWDICEGTNYPKFVWQIPAADFVCPDGVNFIDYAFFAKHWLQSIYGECGEVELTGDGKVNWVDFTLFAEYWMLTGCGECGGADFTGDENVDLADLYVFATYWLGFEYAEVDLTNDGQVGLDDLREFTENWLAGM